MDDLLAALVTKGELALDGKIIVRENIESLGKTFKKIKKVLDDYGNNPGKRSDSVREFHTRLGTVGKYIELDSFIEKLVDLYSSTSKSKVMNLLYQTYSILHDTEDFKKVKWSANFSNEAESFRQSILQNSKSKSEGQSNTEAGLVQQTPSAGGPPPPMRVGAPPAGPPSAGGPPPPMKAGPPPAGPPSAGGPPPMPVGSPLAGAPQIIQLSPPIPELGPMPDLSLDDEDAPHILTEPPVAKAPQKVQLSPPIPELGPIPDLSSGDEEPEVQEDSPLKWLHR